jgi:hypothetical protein
MKPETIVADPSAARRSPANLAFAALLFSFLGWAILERWSFGARTGPLPHLINTLACAPVLACSLRRFRAACPRHVRARPRRRGVMMAGGLALAALFALGAVCGMVAGSGSMTLLALPAALCCCTPWTRLRAHQLHLFLSFLAVAAGSTLAQGLAGQPLQLMSAPPAAWCQLAAAALLCIGLCGDEPLRKKGTHL